MAYPCFIYSEKFSPSHVFIRTSSFYVVLHRWILFGTEVNLYFFLLQHCRRNITLNLDRAMSAQRFSSLLSD